MRAILFAALIALVPSFSNASVNCSQVFGGPRDISADELANILQLSGVELPESFPTDMSDRAKARVRKLHQAIPNLLGRRLNLRLALEEGENGYIIGTLSALTETHVLISIDDLGGKLVPYRKVAIADITSIASINTENIAAANRPEIESARRSGAGARGLLGKRVKISGRLEVEGRPQWSGEGIVIASFPKRQHLLLMFNHVMRFTEDQDVETVRVGSFVQMEVADYFIPKK